MIIRRMRATFGALERAELDLADGLNVICAPNESGKSTWCAFLRAMFYGISSRERDKKGRVAEKNRFQPWSGSPMEGEVDLIWRGRAVTLRRSSRGGAPMSAFEAVDTQTGLAVPELDGESCGETLLGVSRDVWERTAFLSQAPTLSIDGTPELEKRIQSILSSGQEDVSFSDTQDTLKKWRNARQHNQTGMIPRLGKELRELDEKLAQVRDAAGRAAEARARRQELEQSRAAAQAELGAWDALERRELDGRYADARRQEQSLLARVNEIRQKQGDLLYLPTRTDLLDMRENASRWSTRQDERKRAEEEARRASEAADKAEEAARDGRFSGLDGAEAEQRARRDAEKCRELDRKRTSCYRKKTAGLLLAAAGLALGTLAWLCRWLSLPASAAAGGAAVLLGLILWLVSRAKAAEAGRERAAILDRYRAQDPAELEPAARDYRARQDEAQYARRTAAEKTEGCRRRAEEQRGAEEELVKRVAAFAPDAVDMRTAQAAVERTLHLADELDRVQGQRDLAIQRCDDLRAQGAGEEPDGPAPETPAHTRQQAQAELERAERELDAAERQRALAEGELATLGDPAQLEAERARTEDELTRRRREYEALNAALQALERAHDEMQSRFAPELNRLAGQILTELTAGRYENVSLDRDFSASARRQGDVTPHSVLELSRGASDQVYLAVRLAMCRLCLPEEDASPLVLDDALIAFDDERMRLALEHLAGCGRQILLFSCQKRESETGLGSIRHLQS